MKIDFKGIFINDCEFIFESFKWQIKESNSSYVIAFYKGHRITVVGPICVVCNCTNILFTPRTFSCLTECPNCRRKLKLRISEVRLKDAAAKIGKRYFEIAAQLHDFLCKLDKPNADRSD